MAVRYRFSTDASRDLDVDSGEGRPERVLGSFHFKNVSFPHFVIEKENVFEMDLMPDGADGCSVTKAE